MARDGSYLSLRWLLSRKRALTMLMLAGLGLATGGSYGVLTRACAGGMCPSIAVLDNYTAAQSTKILAADGRLITDLGLERRTVLKFNEISPEARAAFLASEDKRFYDHHGIDYYRVFGALWH